MSLVWDKENCCRTSGKGKDGGARLGGERRRGAPLRFCLYGKRSENRRLAKSQKKTPFRKKSGTDVCVRRKKNWFLELRVTEEALLFRRKGGRRMMKTPTKKTRRNPFSMKERLPWQRDQGLGGGKSNEKKKGGFKGLKSPSKGDTQMGGKNIHWSRAG